ncbi:SWIM zinc finger family protein [Mycobacterium sp. CVI_P3]|uniref:SWIM zinc finger family protein n=1 Tax=Mycobacterium pinniadriaticum TaxID=2994102 RepID=A0ABT3S6H4_9MYCO|nr:SWIM zinc finger family protein [Mycobacterium pinniadriaticum]MCX2929031.1 SWIM zinc finger family protein [Mycobacterium pinniadriaticum]MCX2935102.1 SWIM zinc finger family protein [Mycobacterium pinniadriaticum]
MSNWYPATRPRPADGLKARSTRGQIGQTWWSQRFIEVLEAMGMGSRLQRGKNYARRGQVISLEVAPGLVSAQVQGSRARPYRVRIGIVAFDKGQWAQIEGALAENALFAAALLAGEMPGDIEGVFDSVGLALFPGKERELSLDCSCPDDAVPCKHLAATFYLMAEAFDEDPFVILAWRGRERDDLLENLAAARSGRPAADRALPTGPALADCLDSFFVRQNAIPVSRPPVSASTALLDELPEVAVNVRGRGLAELLRPGYAGLAATDSSSATDV